MWVYDAIFLFIWNNLVGKLSKQHRILIHGFDSCGRLLEVEWERPGNAPIYQHALAYHPVCHSDLWGGNHQVCCGQSRTATLTWCYYSCNMIQVSLIMTRHVVLIKKFHQDDLVWIKGSWCVYTYSEWNVLKVLCYYRVISIIKISWIWGYSCRPWCYLAWNLLEWCVRALFEA